MSKTVIIACIWVLSALISNAQQLQLTDINLLGGRNFSTFLFKDSEGNKDKTLDYEALSTFGINFNLSNGRQILRPELSFRQAGAKTDYEGIALSWKMNYLDVNLAYLVNVLNSDRFVVAPGLGLVTGYMLTGEQYIGCTRYSITDTKALRPLDFCFQGLAHFRANITENLALSLEYRFGLGMTQIENDINAQKSRNLYQGAMLVIGIRLK
jgi:hypothetical protein